MNSIVNRETDENKIIETLSHICSASPNTELFHNSSHNRVSHKY